MNAQPLPKVYRLTDASEESVRKRIGKRFVKEWQATRKFLRGHLSDWDSNPQRRLQTYQANEPVFIVSGDLLGWWFESREQPEATLTPPGMVEELMAYWQAQQPQAPAAPPMAVGPKGEMQPDQEAVGQYHAAYQGYEAAMQQWMGLMARLVDGMVLPSDVLGPYWRAMYLRRPGLAEDSLKDYARLTNREVKRQEKAETITGIEDLLMPEALT